MNDNVTRLDMETKVALMAALMYDGSPDVSRVVAAAIELEQESHKQVVAVFRERKLSRSEE